MPRGVAPVPAAAFWPGGGSADRPPVLPPPVAASPPVTLPSSLPLSGDRVGPLGWGFGEFTALRDRLDPDRLFQNDYLRRVLGA